MASLAAMEGYAPGGHAERFVGAYEKHAARVLAYIRAILRDDDAAEDVLHDVFLKAHRALEAGQYPRQLEAWLLTIARTTAIDHWRRRRGEQPCEPESLAALADRRVPVERFNRSSWISDPEVLAALEQLSPLQRDVILLRYVVGCAHAETARLLESTEAAVIQVHRRALAALSAHLAGSDLAAHRSRSAHAMHRRRARRSSALGGFTLLMRWSPRWAR